MLAFSFHSLFVSFAPLIYSQTHFHISLQLCVRRRCIICTCTILYCFHFIRAKVYLTRRTLRQKRFICTQKSSFTKFAYASYAFYSVLLQLMVLMLPPPLLFTVAFISIVCVLCFWHSVHLQRTHTQTHTTLDGMPEIMKLSTRN